MEYSEYVCNRDCAGSQVGAGSWDGEESWVEARNRNGEGSRVGEKIHIGLSERYFPIWGTAKERFNYNFQEKARNLPLSFGVIGFFCIFALANEPCAPKWTLAHANYGPMDEWFSHRSAKPSTAVRIRFGPHFSSVRDISNAVFLLICTVFVRQVGHIGLPKPIP